MNLGPGPGNTNTFLIANRDQIVIRLLIKIRDQMVIQLLIVF